MQKTGKGLLKRKDRFCENREEMVLSTTTAIRTQRGPVAQTECVGMVKR
jgi:hypothetical protein